MAAAASFFEQSTSSLWGSGGSASAQPDATSLDGDFEGARYQFDLDFDMDCLRRALLEQGRELDESGYQSVLQRSQHSQYGTGWMMFDSASIASSGSADEWGKSMHA